MIFALFYVNIHASDPPKMYFRIFFLLLFSLTLTLNSFAQSPSKLLKQANSEYESMAYVKAIELFEETLKKEKNLTENDLQNLRIKLAWSYRQIKDYYRAEWI